MPNKARCSAACESVSGRCQPPRQERLVVIGGLGVGQCLEEGDQIRVGAYTVGLAGFKQRVEVGAGGSAADGVAEQSVAASDDERSDSVVAGVFRDRRGPVVEVTAQLRPLAVQVVQGLADQAMRQHGA